MSSCGKNNKCDFEGLVCSNGFCLCSAEAIEKRQACGERKVCVPGGDTSCAVACSEETRNVCDGEIPGFCINEGNHFCRSAKSAADCENGVFCDCAKQEEMIPPTPTTPPKIVCMKGEGVGKDPMCKMTSETDEDFIKVKERCETFHKIWKEKKGHPGYESACKNEVKRALKEKMDFVCVNSHWGCVGKSKTKDEPQRKFCHNSYDCLLPPDAES